MYIPSEDVVWNQSVSGLYVSMRATKSELKLSIEFWTKNTHSVFLSALWNNPTRSHTSSKVCTQLLASKRWCKVNIFPLKSFRMTLTGDDMVRQWTLGKYNFSTVYSITEHLGTKIYLLPQCFTLRKCLIISERCSENPARCQRRLYVGLLCSMALEQRMRA